MILSRIAIDQIAQNVSYQEVLQQIHSLDERFAKYLTEDQWCAFVKKEKTEDRRQKIEDRRREAEDILTAVC